MNYLTVSSTFYLEFIYQTVISKIHFFPFWQLSVSYLKNQKKEGKGEGEREIMAKNLPNLGKETDV